MKTLKEQYTLSANQTKDIVEIESKRNYCLLLDPYSPFNCISCRSGYAINIETKKCELVVQSVEFCEEYVSFQKQICVRCKTGYVLDYGINLDIFKETTILSKRSYFPKYYIEFISKYIDVANIIS